MERLEAEPKKRGCIGGGDLAFAFETGKIPHSSHPGFLVSTATGADTSSLEQRPTILIKRDGTGAPAVPPSREARETKRGFTACPAINLAS
ncbi:hypothetical protein [Paenibacillus lautus]|uniref:hypothetical protein n=1 Tax=Paenibacillus lautus TaxID=1401 RepID=UPI002DBF24EC|nr:hypothetical protein [Paenibacillus lautus]MEC0257734.1 hypothetical protein [Paenibacillus lautus]